MFIITGRSNITSRTQSGVFHCPSCRSESAFSRKKVRRFVTLFFVPVIPLDSVGDYVECHRCGGIFHPEVLGLQDGISQAPRRLGAPWQDAKGGNAALASSPSATITAQSNGLALTSLILGIFALVTSFLLCLALPIIALSVVFGILGLLDTKNAGGRGLAIAGLACSALGVVTMLVIAAILFHSAPGKGNGWDSPRERAVARLLSTADSTAYGNGSQARDLAKVYAGVIQKMDGIYFTSTRAVANTDRRYVVHCELRAGTCAFLVYVPEYRKFTGEAKAQLEKLAWDCAQQVATQSGGLPKNTEVCVALKGVLLFGAVMTGRVGDRKPTSTGTDEAVIDYYFTSPEAPTNHAPRVLPDTAPPPTGRPTATSSSNGPTVIPSTIPNVKSHTAGPRAHGPSGFAHSKNTTRPPSPLPPVLQPGGQRQMFGGRIGALFRDVAPAKGMLVGFEVGLGTWGPNVVVSALRPIYVSARGDEVLGQQHGIVSGQVMRVKAERGYAVGAITAKSAVAIDGFSLTFMRISEDRLDPRDKYESDWVGGKGGALETTTGGNGLPAIGIVGHCNNGECTAVGLIFAPAKAGDSPAVLGVEKGHR